MVGEFHINNVDQIFQLFNLSISMSKPFVSEHLDDIYDFELSSDLSSDIEDNLAKERQRRQDRMRQDDNSALKVQIKKKIQAYKEPSLINYINNLDKRYKSVDLSVTKKVHMNTRLKILQAVPRKLSVISVNLHGGISNDSLISKKIEPQKFKVKIYKKLKDSISLIDNNLSYHNSFNSIDEYKPLQKRVIFDRNSETIKKMDPSNKFESIKWNRMKRLTLKQDKDDLDNANPQLFFKKQKTRKRKHHFPSIYDKIKSPKISKKRQKENGTRVRINQRLTQDKLNKKLYLSFDLDKKSKINNSVNSMRQSFGSIQHLSRKKSRNILKKKENCWQYRLKFLLDPKNSKENRIGIQSLINL